jgi:sec-independent protein translocase protein TatB
MLDIGWTELLLIGAVALIVVGPKDLPRMMRTLGQYVGKAKAVAREFQRSMDDAAREAELDDLKKIADPLKDLKDMRRISLDDGAKPRAAAKPKPDAPPPAAEPAAAPAAEPAAAPAATKPEVPAPAPTEPADQKGGV